MTRFVTLLAAGITYAAVLSLVALGFLVLYKATAVLNFAHGALVTFGGYVALWAIVTLGLPIVAGYVLAIVLLFLIGVAVERVAYAPLRARPPLVVVIATLAAAIMLQGIAAVWQGAYPKSLPTPVTGTVTIAGAAIPKQDILVVAVSAVVVTGVLLLFQKTSFGRQVRAVAADPDTALLCGVRTRMLSMVAFGMSAALACLAGVLVVPLTALNLTFGFTLMIDAFAAAVLGGFGSLGGVVLGAIIVALVQQLLGGYVLTGYADSLPFVVMVVALAIRPQGLIVFRTSRL
ncbi:MAG TPA: branched-chain amino acid ABC transporter permease [Acidimicrobiales bacterium]|nr:branched-chain amino acid ABC transporter permease [Acidimicrobiales bacterium]